MSATATSSSRVLRALLCAVVALLVAAPAAAAANWTSGNFAADLTSSTPLGLTPSASGGTPVFDYPTQPIVLSWSSVGGAAGYQLQIATLENFAASTVVVDVRPSRPLFVSTLTNDGSGKLYQNGSYYWRVRAVTGGSLGAWSSYESFRRSWSSLPTGLQFVDEDGSVATSTSLGGYISWNPVPGAASYDVELMPTDTASTISMSKDSIPDTRIVLPHLPDDTYTWRVRAKDASGNAGAWVDGPPLTFDWTPMSYQPGDVYPADGARTSDYRVGWKPVGGASYYQAEFATRPGCFWEPGTSAAVAPKQYGSWPGESATAGASVVYYEDTGFAGATVAQTIGDVNITAAPGGLATPGTFSAKVTTQVTFTADGTYMLRASANGGVRMWIIDDNGRREALPNFWPADTGVGNDVSSGSPGMQKTAGESVRVEIWYQETTGPVSLTLNWDFTPSGGGMTTSRVPAEALSTMAPLDYRAYCRVSEIGAHTTSNSWITREMIPTWNEIVADATQASDSNPNAPNRPCTTPAGFGTPPVTGGGVVNWLNNCQTGSVLPQNLYWIVRPAASVTTENETIWRLRAAETEFFGSWLVTPSGAPFSFSRTEPLDTSNVTPTGCASPDNPTGDDCLEQQDSQLRVDDPLTADADPSLQVPLLRWNAFPTAEGYLVQIATDPNFNQSRIVCQEAVPASFQTSLEPTCKLADNSQTTGYYWRVVPCSWETSPGQETSTNCIPMYFMGQATAGAKNFVKRGVVSGLAVDLSRTMPLLQWQRIDGADHYEVQLARNPFFVDAESYRTTSRMLVPYDTASDDAQSPGTTQLPDGSWYWRVRAVDRDKLASGWSATSAFTKRIPSPTPTAPGSGTTAAVADAVLRWEQVPQAQQYEVQWSASPEFGGASQATTGQTAYALSAPGRWYWRIRVVQGSITGEWSASRTLTVVDDPAIRYSLSKPTLYAGDKVFIDGLLTVDGNGASGRRLTLQRKSTVCGGRGRYGALAAATTGSVGDEGTLRFGLRALQNQCFRLAWSDGTRVHHSAPFATKVRPRTRVRLSARSVRRGRAFFATVRTNRSVSGRVRLQYRSKGKWVTAKTQRVSRVSTVRLRVTLSRSGSYQTRVVLDQLGTFVDTTVAGPKVRVNDLWSLYYVKSK